MSEEDAVETLKKTFKVEGLPPKARLEVRIRGRVLVWDHTKRKLVEGREA